MKKNKGYYFIIPIIIVFFSYTIGYAADQLYRLMHNDHDALVIGEVTESSENEITVDVEKQIVSSKDISLVSPNKQITIKGTITVGRVTEYALFYEDKSTESRPQKGDYVLVSINKTGNNFINAWGIYKLDSKDYKTLNIIYPKDASIYIKMDAAAIKYFVNSNGTKNEFSFDGNQGKVYSGKKLIYDGSLENENSSVYEDISALVPIDENSGESKGNTILNFNNSTLFLVTTGTILAVGVISAYMIKRK